MVLTSNQLFERLKEMEGCRLEAYEDAAGVWTIGYGHTRGVKKGDKISQYYAEDSLRRDIAEAEAQVLKLDVCRTQGELDALVSFVFNVGIGRLKESTLLRLIRSSMPKEIIMKEFRRWTYANGKRMNGLWARRNWEAKRFFEPSDTLEEVEEKIREREQRTIVRDVEQDDEPIGYCEV